MGNALASKVTWEEKLKKLQNVIDEYDALATEFIDKVDNGMARSKRTYHEFKRILNRD